MIVYKKNPTQGASTPTRKSKAGPAKRKLAAADAGLAPGIRFDPGLDAAATFHFSQLPLPAPGPTRVQARLTFGRPGDQYEREADAVADKIRRMPESAIQSKCAHCEEEERKLRRKPLAPAFTPIVEAKGGAGAIPVSPALMSRIQVTRGSGSPLPDTTRSFMESRFGADFSQVRIHAGEDAVQMSKGLSAQAFTVGNDIYFNSGKFAPASAAGRHLLAHELTHTIQQEVGGKKRIQRQCSPTGCKCGPDATDWFVRQVNSAMRDPDVLSIQRDLRLANMLLITSGISTDELAEAGATTAIEAQQLNLWLRNSLPFSSSPPPPAPNPTISSQLLAGAISRSRVLASRGGYTISPAASSVVAATATLGVAALNWKALVDHAARYDFKAHRDSMNHPHSATCPDDGCIPAEVGVITLCPGAARENCYESDLPGNLFYALIGRFAGWSELTLQLGSQLAELTDTRITSAHPAITWDSPADTAAITLGYHLPLPLTAAALCSSLGPARSTLSIKSGCIDCLEATPSIIR